MGASCKRQGVGILVKTDVELFDVALGIGAPAIYLQAPASNAHLQIMFINVNR